MGEMWQWIMQLLSHGQGASMGGASAPALGGPNGGIGGQHTKPLQVSPAPTGAMSNDRMYTGGSPTFNEHGGPMGTPNRGISPPALNGGSNPMNMLMRMMAR